MSKFSDTVKSHLKSSDRWTVNALLALNESPKFTKDNIGDSYTILTAFNASWSKSRDNHTPQSIQTVRDKIINNEECIDILSDLYAIYLGEVPF